MKLVRIVSGLVLSAALLAFAGCGGGGGGGGTSTTPTGTATVQGQMLREPTVAVSAAPAGIRAWLWAALRVADVWAATPGPVPVPNMRVTLSANGQPIGSTTTDGAGRFRFEGVPAGALGLQMQDRGGQHAFEHAMRMDRAGTLTTYCVLWGSGPQMSCADEAGDHWDDMVGEGPAGRWDMGGHGWRTGMM